MSERAAEVVICGAGIAGRGRWRITWRCGAASDGVVLVDERPPLSLTSDKSAESYRNWWPGPGDAMVALMNRSIDLLEELARESGNVFRMNRRGYLFATADPARSPDFIRAAEEATDRGAAAARVHATARERLSPGARRRLRGAAGREPTSSPIASLIRRAFPLPGRGHGGAAPRPALRLVQRPAARHVLARAAREKGVRLIEGRVESGRCHRRAREAASPWRDRAAPGAIATPRFVNAAGPFTKARGPSPRRGAAGLLRAPRQGRVQRHCCGAVPRAGAHDDLDRSGAAAVDGRTSARSCGSLTPSGISSRNCPPACTAGRRAAGESPVVLGIWTYDVEPVEPTFPIALRSGLRGDRDPRAVANDPGAGRVRCSGCPGRSWTGATTPRREENRFLACPLPVEGAYRPGGLLRLRD